MSQLFIGLAFLLHLAGAGFDEPAQGANKSLAEEVKAQTVAYAKQRDAVIARLGKAKDDDERNRIHADYIELNQRFGKTFLELARKDPKDPGAYEAIAFGFTLGSDRPEMLRLIRTYHVEHKKIGDLCANLAYDDAAIAEEILKAIAEHNPEKENQGKALFSLGMRYKWKADRRGVSEAEMAGFIASAEKAFTAVKANYAEVVHFSNKLGLSAEQQMLGLKNMPLLQIGKQAPEIIGEDLDGKPIKLSDYRGKVVVLDFWGHW